MKSLKHYIIEDFVMNNNVDVNLKKNQIIQMTIYDELFSYIEKTYNLSKFDDITIYHSCPEELDLTNIRVNKEFCHCGYAFRNAKCSEIDISTWDIDIIGPNMFKGCINLLNFNFPYSLESIEESAFESCKKLTEVNLPPNLTNIGMEAFSMCSELTNVTMGDKVTHIRDFAFSLCKKLKSITLSKKLKYIGAYAFGHCEAIDEIILPDSVEKIDFKAFYDCKELKTIYIPASVKHIEESAFSFCTKLKSIKTPKGNKGTLFNILSKQGNDSYMNLDEIIEEV